MKKVITATALAIFGLAPAIATACDDYDVSASASLPPQTASTASVPVTKAPAKTVARTVAPNAVKQVATKVNAPAPEQKPKLAASAAN